MAQSAIPNATTSIGSYTDQGGGTTNIHLTIDDDVDAPNNADFIRSPLAPTNAPYVCKLSTIEDPQSSGNHKIRVVLAKDASGGAQINATIQLRQGYVNEGTPGTLIATLSQSNITETFTLYEYTLSSGEADSITDYSDLFLRVVFNQV